MIPVTLFVKRRVPLVKLPPDFLQLSQPFQLESQLDGLDFSPRLPLRLLQLLLEILILSSLSIQLPLRLLRLASLFLALFLRCLGHPLSLLQFFCQACPLVCRSLLCLIQLPSKVSSYEFQLFLGHLQLLPKFLNIRLVHVARLYNLAVSLHRRR